MRQRVRILRLGWIALGVIAVVGFVIVLLGPVTSWASGSTVHHLHGKERADAVNAVRQTLLQASGGAAALIVLVFTGMTFVLNRRGQVTDRYAKAIAMLASDKLDERIGGIFALEHVMIESERDHDTIVQVLATFVRQHAPTHTTKAPRIPADADRWMHPPEGTPNPHQSREADGPAADIQAALTVLARRPRREEARGLDLRRTDLSGMDLGGARLDGVNLQGSRLANTNLRKATVSEGSNLQDVDLSNSNLIGTNFDNANLYKANLSGADLSGADFRRASLNETNLRGTRMFGGNFEGASLFAADLFEAIMIHARLKGATLIHARLSCADLRMADLTDAKMRDAHLKDTDLRQAQGLTQAQIDAAAVNARTQLPQPLSIERISI